MTVQETFQIPALNPSDIHKTSPLTTDALSRGFALFTLGNTRANDKKPISFRKISGEPIPSGPPRTVYGFYSILAKEPEEIYEFWGMIIAALRGLVSLVDGCGEKWKRRRQQTMMKVKKYVNLFLQICLVTLFLRVLLI